jgi:thymidylate kinase
MNNKLIIFSGLDGAGKSTQIGFLSNYFTGIGQNINIYWARIGYTNSFEKLKSFLRKSINKKIPKPGHSEERNKLFKNNLIFKIWITLSLIDLIYLWTFKIRYKLLKGNIVICDRYIIDSELDIKQNFPNYNLNNNLLWKFLKSTIPDTKNKFFLWVDVETSINRSIIKNEPFPDSKEILIWRLNNYFNHNEISNKYIKIKCDKEVIEVKNLVKDSLFI